MTEIGMRMFPEHTNLQVTIDGFATQTLALTFHKTFEKKVLLISKTNEKS